MAEPRHPLWVCFAAWLLTALCVVWFDPLPGTLLALLVSLLIAVVVLMLRMIVSAIRGRSSDESNIVVAVVVIDDPGRSGSEEASERATLVE